MNTEVVYPDPQVPRAREATRSIWPEASGAFLARYIGRSIPSCTCWQVTPFISSIPANTDQWQNR